MTTRNSPFAGRQVLILSNAGWDSPGQTHHVLTENMARAGADVYFVEDTGFHGLRLSDIGRFFGRLMFLLSRPRPRNGCRIVTTLVLPPTSPLFRAANSLYLVPWLLKKLRRRGMKKDPIVIANLPTETTLAILDHLEPALTIYDCVDDFASRPGPPEDLAETEAELLRRSDLVLTASRDLYESKMGVHPQVRRFHHGDSSRALRSPGKGNGRCRKPGPDRSGEARGHARAQQLKTLERYVDEAFRSGCVASRAYGPRGLGLPSTVQSFLRGFSWITLFFVLARAATFIAQFMAARFLGPTEYGKAHLVIAVTSLMQIVPILGFPLALSRFGSVEETEAGQRRVVSTSFYAFLLWAGLCLAAFWALSPRLAPLSQLDPYAWMLALCYTFLTALHLVAASALQGLHRFKHRGRVEAIYGISAVLVLTGLLLAGWRGFETLIVSFMAGLAAAALYALWILRPYLQLRIDLRWLPSALPFIVLGVINILSLAFVQAPGRIAVFHFRSAQLAGIYSAYFTSTAQIALAITFMANTVIIPLASRTQGQRDAWRIIRSLGLKGTLCMLAFFAACAYLALLLIGRSYPLRLEWLGIFTASAVLILVHGVISAVFAARDLRGLAVSSIGALIAGLGNLFLNMILTPAHGITGGAVALLLGYLLGLLWYLLYLPKRGPSASLS